MHYSLVVVVFNLLNVIAVNAIPAWEGGRSAINSLVTGAGYIEALRAPREAHTEHLSIAPLGTPGNLTVAQNYKAPPLFYINGGQLWQPINETTIFSVNLLNTTHVPFADGNYPLQLVLAPKQNGIRGGYWRWDGTMLYYDNPPLGNQGLFYTCYNEAGLNGVFLFLRPAATPPGCHYFTMHSWIRQYIKETAGRR